MWLKLRLLFAILAIPTLPQIAHACTGNACDSITPTPKIKIDNGFTALEYTLFNSNRHEAPTSRSRDSSAIQPGMS